MLAKNLANGFSSLYTEVAIRIKSLLHFLSYPLKDFSWSPFTIVNNYYMFRFYVFNVTFGLLDKSLFAIDYDKLPCTKSLSIDILFFKFGGEIPPSKEQTAEWEADSKKRRQEDDDFLRNLIAAKDG